MDDMTDGITFERVTRTDLDDIVGLAQAAWYSPDGLGDLAAGTLDEAGLDGDEREAAARLLATDEVASYLAESTWGMKALLDGQVVGIILTQGTHASAEASAYWEGVGRQAREAAERKARARAAGHQQFFLCTEAVIQTRKAFADHSAKLNARALPSQ